MYKVGLFRPALVIALLLAGVLSSALFLTGYASAAPLRANGTASPTTIDATQIVYFTCTATGGTPPYTYTWAFGDSGTSVLQNPFHVYSTAGSFVASVIVTDAVSGTDSWTSGTITVNALPSVTGTAVPMTIDEGQSVSFTCTPSDGTPPFTYLWDFGDGSPDSTQQNPTHAYAAAGAYTANVTVTDDVGGLAYWTVAITVNAQATVTGTATPAMIDATQTVQFTCTPSYGTPPYTYAWTFGDGNTSNVQNPSHAYASEGAYTANVTVTDAVGGQASWSTAITVNALPNLTGTAAPTTVNSGQIVSFVSVPTLGTPPYTYSWDFGNAPGQFADGTTNQSQSPYYEFENSGSSAETYTVTITVTDGVGGQASWTITITVNALPSVTGVASPATIDETQSASFTCTADFGSGVYVSYQWSFGDGTTDTSADQYATHEYDNAGIYTVTVIVTDSLAQRAIWTVNVTVNVLPSVTGTATPTIIDSGKNVSFTCSPEGGTAPYTYLWTFGDGSTSTTQSPDHRYAAVGTYTVNLTLTDAANKTAEWSTVITVNSGASGVSLVVVVGATSVAILVSAILLMFLMAKRKRKSARAAEVLPSKDVTVSSAATPKTLMPVEQPPAKKNVGSPQKKDPLSAPIAVPKSPAPVEQPPVQKKVKPLQEVDTVVAPSAALKKTSPVEQLRVTKTRQGPESNKKICPLCTYMNDPDRTVCEICRTKLK